MRYIIIFCIISFLDKPIEAQLIIKMEKIEGVYQIPCKINGLPLKFIFDTGASEVTISLSEAIFMLKNGYLYESDIKGKEYYSIANGDISEGTKINIKKLEIGNLILNNVEATIIHSTKAPLLFGQSAMERFGKFTIDYSNSNLIIDNLNNTSSIKTVKIGNQTWMTENLNIEMFVNGDKIEEVKTFVDWMVAYENKKPAFCYYNFDANNGMKYGKLYNWYAVNDNRKLAPEGWKIPNELEWMKFTDFLKSKIFLSKSFKYHKKIDDRLIIETDKKMNFFGFSNILSGLLAYTMTSFNYINETGYYWSSTETTIEEATAFSISNQYIYKDNYSKRMGFAIRCLKDN